MKPEHITAWALNELAPEDRARLESELQADPATQETAASTRQFCEFLTQELRDDTVALSAAQKARILAATPAAGSTAPRFAPRPLRWWQRPAIPMAAAASLIAGISAYFTLVQEANQDPLDALAAAPLNEADQRRISLPAKPAAEAAAHQALQPPLPGSPLKPMEGSESFAATLRQAPAMPAAASVTLTSPQVALGNGIAIKSEAAAAPGMPKPFPTSRHPSVPVGRKAPTNTRFLPPGQVSTAQRIVDDLKKQRLESSAREGDGQAETYAPITENTLTSVAREPLSTFSVDVDTASYANVRRFLNQNTRPPRDAVRIEELINYFPTAEPGPAAKAEHPFAVRAEMAACPWQPQHRLLRVHLKGRDVPTGTRPSNLVFLVDVSGSMASGDKLPLVQRSLRMLVERLGENDRVALVTYAGGTEVVLAATNGTEKAAILAAIDHLRPGGSTAGAAGIRLAYEEAVRGFIQDGVNRVLLCTDGDFNVGISDPKELETFITEKARSGVFLSVLGFGTGNLKDHSMETLADKGNGNYAYIDSVGEARKVLVEQMQGTLVTLAKDVKIQVEFNPAVVREYRLIGYENRMLAKEDFNDDRKDAGEIGAGHSVTALYELVPASLPPGAEPRPVVDKLKYQPAETPLAAAPARKLGDLPADEALTVKLRYKEPAGSASKLLEVPVKDDARPLEQAGAEFQFSAAVAGFGLLLRESPSTGQLTWDQVRQLARSGKGADPLGYRGEFLQLIEKAAR